MKIDNTSVLTSAIDEIIVGLENGVESIRNGMWWSIFDKDREEFDSDDILKIMIDDVEKHLSVKQIDEIILNKCEDLTVDIEKAISSKNGMVLILNNNGER